MGYLLDPCQFIWNHLRHFMENKHEKVMRLFKNQTIHICKMSENENPVVKLYAEKDQDAEDLFNWLAAITGDNSGDSETVNLLWNDWQ